MTRLNIARRRVPTPRNRARHPRITRRLFYNICARTLASTASRKTSRHHHARDGIGI